MIPPRAGSIRDFSFARLEFEMESLELEWLELYFFEVSSAVRSSLCAAMIGPGSVAKAAF